MKPWVSALAVYIPVISFLSATGVAVTVAVDNRYMKADTANIRYIELQRTIIKGHIREVTRAAASGKLSPDDASYLREQEQELHFLNQRRQELLGE